MIISLILFAEIGQDKRTVDLPSHLEILTLVIKKISRHCQTCAREMHLTLYQHSSTVCHTHMHLIQICILLLRASILLLSSFNIIHVIPWSALGLRFTNVWNSHVDWHSLISANNLQYLGKCKAFMV